MSEILSQNNLEDKLSMESMSDSKLENSVIKDNGAEDVSEVTPNKKFKLSNDLKDEKQVLTSGGSGRPSKDKKRLTILEKTTKEGEALLKDLGHKTDDDPNSTKRQTRSQTRGTPASVPPPVKKTTPKSPQKVITSSGITPKRRGRPPKNSITNNNSVETKTEVKTNAKKDEKSENETEEKVNNTNNTDGNDESISDVHKEEQSNESNANENEEEEEEEEGEERPEVNNDQNCELSQNDNNNKPNSISSDNSNSAVETHITTD